MIPSEVTPERSSSWDASRLRSGGSQAGEGSGAFGAGADTVTTEATPSGGRWGWPTIGRFIESLWGGYLATLRSRWKRAVAIAGWWMRWSGWVIAPSCAIHSRPSGAWG